MSGPCVLPALCRAAWCGDCTGYCIHTPDTHNLPSAAGRASAAPKLYRKVWPADRPSSQRHQRGTAQGSLCRRYAFRKLLYSADTVQHSGCCIGSPLLLASGFDVLRSHASSSSKSSQSIKTLLLLGVTGLWGWRLGAGGEGGGGAHGWGWGGGASYLGSGYYSLRVWVMPRPGITASEWRGAGAEGRARGVVGSSWCCPFCLVDVVVQSASVFCLAMLNGFLYQ